MEKAARLLADIGGTNARFAWQDDADAPLTDVRSYPVRDHPSLELALRRYLADLQRTAPPWCAIGIANPITGDRVQMTNHAWSFSIAGLRRALGFARLEVVNDFTALALALPVLAPDQLRQVGGVAAVPETPIGLVGPGTGLGVSGLLPVPGLDRWVPLQGEGGHVTLSPTTERENAVLLALHRRFGHASAERAVSGPGLVSLVETLCRLDGKPAPAGLTGALVTRSAIAAHDAHSVEALEMFFGFLGCVAGNLALTLGARGGIYVGGGIVPQIADALERSDFRARFEAKGRFAPYLAAIPVFVIQSPTSPALLGASRALL
ncbi:glucokinase [Methylibium sp.]|uniref:glucokinase n=1 Tax=Methylibium sp. TaxID=2067992 RepID=UPI003D1345A3